MSKTALVFPGQGSQCVGMGQTVYNESQTAKNLFELGNKIVGKDLTKLCFETDIETLSETVNSQPAIFTVSLCLAKLLEEKGLKFDGVCGFSLGEVTALAVANIFDTENSFITIAKRGEFMQQASNNSNGGMAAIIGLENNVVESVCKSTKGYVIPVNYNCPKQLVIAGEKEALELAMNECIKLGAMKATMLKVSAAFHSELMQDASISFYNSIKDIKTCKQTCDIYSNVYGDKLPNDFDVAKYLQKQMTSPVKFENVITKMIEDGYTRFIEVGAGKVLSGLIKRINKSVQIENVSDLESLNKLA